MKQSEQSQTKTVDPVDEAWNKMLETEKTFVEACRAFVGADLKLPRSDWEDEERDHLRDWASEAGCDYQVALGEYFEIEEAVKAEPQAVKEFEDEASEAEALSPKTNIRLH